VCKKKFVKKNKLCAALITLSVLGKDIDSLDGVCKKNCKKKSVCVCVCVYFNYYLVALNLIDTEEDRSHVTKFIISNSKYYSTSLIIDTEEDRSHVTKFITDMGDFLQTASEQVKKLGDAQVR